MMKMFEGLFSSLYHSASKYYEGLSSSYSDSLHYPHGQKQDKICPLLSSFLKIPFVLFSGHRDIPNPICPDRDKFCPLKKPMKQGGNFPSGGLFWSEFQLIFLQFRTSGGSKFSPAAAIFVCFRVLMIIPSRLPSLQSTDTRYSSLPITGTVQYSSDAVQAREARIFLQFKVSKSWQGGNDTRRRRRRKFLGFWTSQQAISYRKMSFQKLKNRKFFACGGLYII